MLCHATNNGAAVALLIVNKDVIAALETAAAEGSPAASPTLADLMPISMLVFLAVTGTALAASVVVLLLTTRPVREAGGVRSA